MTFLPIFLSALVPHRLRFNQWKAEHEAAIGTMRELVIQLRPLDDAALRRQVEELRTTPTIRGQLDLPKLTQTFALAIEALRRTRGVELFDQQLEAALAMARGAVAEMQTGEGKTFSTLPVALWRALAGRGVHVVTPNAYLAERDAALLRPAFELLGFTVGLLPEQADQNSKRRAYQADVTYGTGYEFGFDYLRDQLRRRTQPREPLGQQLLRQWAGGVATAPSTQRGLPSAIIDEIDNVLLDDAISPLVLSGEASREAEDAAAYFAARDTAARLLEPEHFIADTLTNSLHLTPAGQQRIHQPEIAIPLDQLRRSWTEYVEQALFAERFLRRDVHYVVDGDDVRIVDATTGRIFQDRSWRDGLHQAVEAKEGVRVSSERTTLAQITRQRFYRLYETLCGMTGTATGCETEFRYVYQLAVVPISPRLPSRRKILPTRSFATCDAKQRAIIGDVVRLHASGRPVLIGTRTIADSELLARQLAAAGVSFQLLNGRQDAAEAEIVSRAGQRSAVTIATNLAGRGTDIKLDPTVAELGGLHVIVAECHPSSRSDRQLIGRCARQGDPGSAQSFVAADDAVVQRHGQWLAHYLRRHAEPNGELRQDLSSAIQRLQLLADRAEYSGRCALLRRDNAQDALWSGAASGN